MLGLLLFIQIDCFVYRTRWVSAQRLIEMRLISRLETHLFILLQLSCSGCCVSCAQHRRSVFLCCQRVEAPALRVEDGIIPEAPLVLKADLRHLRVSTTAQNGTLGVCLSDIVQVLEY